MLNVCSSHFFNTFGVPPTPLGTGCSDAVLGPEPIDWTLTLNSFPSGVLSIGPLTDRPVAFETLATGSPPANSVLVSSLSLVPASWLRSVRILSEPLPNAF